VADRQGNAGEPVDHESDPAAAGHHAQKKTLIAREQSAEQRAAWQERLRTVEASRLLFLDETSTPTTLTPLRGRAPRGQRVVGRVPRGRWHSVSLLASLGIEGLGPGLQVEGAIDRDAFETFVAEQLVPILQPGQIVVPDNRSVHKSARARQLIEAAGAELGFLPTYSPDFNPIEQAFSKLKHHLRQAAADTRETVQTETERLWPTITAANARAYFTAAGYNL
jgi:transposase